MKRFIPSRWPCLLLVLMPGVLIAGCPFDAAGLIGGDTIAGTYWVEYRDGELAAFALPTYRGEAGTWHTLTTARPAWYTGPALYEVNADGSWERLTDDPNLTLDDVLQLHDPPPAPPADSAEL